ncbi:MAG: tetraether lipid synthase Tes [Methanotrichaceae archaeon]
MSLTTVDKKVPSLCPICHKVIEAHLFEKDGAVKLVKSCQEDGEFEDVYWSDAHLYKKFDQYKIDGNGVDNPNTHPGQECPRNCGLCQNHKTGTLLAIIDLTNRCNLKCPVCFANAEVTGHLYEPSLDMIREMMQNLRDEQPVPCPAVQFSGGEPTLREDLPQITAMARDMGFSQIQIATNGIKLAGSLELCRSLVRNGMHTIYLQFDGVTPEPYISLRGRDILSIKMKVLENCRRSGLTSVVLVPTLERGVNDDQMGDMVRFAARNLDVVKGVNVQPVSFTGRIDQEERSERRITIPDFLALLEEQTDNQITREDFYPVPFVAPISHLLEAETGLPQVLFSVHPHCGAATYIFHHQGKLIPINRFVDVVGFYELIKDVVADFNGSRLDRLKMNGKIIKELPRLIDESKAPDDLYITKMIMNVLKYGTRESLKEFHNKTLFLGAMHFQDLYNIDLERVQRCGIHYATPDGRIIPFCTYNTLHRQEVEDRFSVDLKPS